MHCSEYTAYLTGAVVKKKFQLDIQTAKTDDFLFFFTVRLEVQHAAWKGVEWKSGSADAK